MNNNEKMIAIDDTRFIYDTNFAGDPAKDHFGDTRRKANIVIPDPRQAEEMLAKGFRVRQTKPGPDVDPNDFIPTYFVQAVLKYRDRYGKPMKYPPKVYLVNMDGDPKPLDEETVSVLDSISVANVNVILNAWKTDDGSYSLYIRTMYIEQDYDDDPYAARYARRRDE
ncbi:MAG: hypothetical protein J6U54_03590 [Clostridiales bacterium]|nr:hypothetical protein [Clostridiales bacterium]